MMVFVAFRLTKKNRIFLYFFLFFKVNSYYKLIDLSYNTHLIKIWSMFFFLDTNFPPHPYPPPPIFLQAVYNHIRGIRCHAVSVISILGSRDEGLYVWN